MSNKSYRHLSLFLIYIIVVSNTYYLAARQYLSLRKTETQMVNISNISDVLGLFPTTAQEIKERTEQYIHNAQQMINALIAISDNERIFANTAQALDTIAALSNLAITDNAVSVLEILSPNEDIRKAVHDAAIKIKEFYVDQISNNVKIYRVFKAYVEGNALQEDLSSEQQYFLRKTMDDFKRAGLDLPEQQLEEVKQLKKDLAALAQNFKANIAADSSSITVNREGLQGLNDDFIDNVKRTDDGLYILGVDYPTYFNVMEHCLVEDTRKQLYLVFMNRAYPANGTILQEVIAKRDQLANKLGFTSYAHLEVADQMVGSPERAEQFIQDLIVKVQKKEQQEFEQLTSGLPESVTLTPEGKMKPWDGMYARSTYKKKHFNIDERVIAEYFSMEKTVEGLLDIYKQFLSIHFNEVPISGAWHEDVKLIEVYNASGNVLLGYLLLDLHPRLHKYSHAAHASIVPSIKDSNGKNNISVSVVMANFPKSTPTKPSLLRRKDVSTFFHEFGHALHALLGRTTIASLSGTNVKADFIELPSQILEEWLWDKDILKKVSSHYQTGESLPDKLIDTIIMLKNFASGSFVQQQSFYSMLSLTYFADGADKDIYQIMKYLYQRILTNSAFDSHYHIYASFSHLMNYGSRYYGYLWSKVFALDIFNEIKQHGLLNPGIGRKYVQEILSKGGSENPNILLRNFLGREPNQEAFLKDLGL